MIVYGEILVAENFIIGGALLYITAQIYGIGFAERQRKLRLLAGSLLCGAFALVIFLPVKMPVTVMMEGVFAFVVCFVVFGRERLWQKAIAFFLATYFMGGMTMALLLVTGNPGIYTATGLYTGDMKGGFLALFVGVSLMTAKQIIRTVSRRKFYGEHTYQAKLMTGDRCIQVSAFLDSGNQLKEPVSGKPVAIASESLWKRMQSCGLLQEERFCVVPYEAIGSKGVLMAVRTDQAEIGGNIIKGCVVAKGNGAFQIAGNDSADCDLLLSKHMTDGKF